MEIDKHKKQFGNQAENYTKYRLPYIKSLHELLFSLISEKEGKILDVACGTGKSTEPLVSGGLEVFGVDHDPLMIDEAKKQALSKDLNISYSVADAENLPFPDKTFDVVTVGTAFHWFVNTKAISEIKRVLKDGGLLFIFWTLTTKEIPEEDQIPASIFRSYNWERVPQKLRDLDHVSNFLIENGLGEVKTVRLPFTYNTTVEERVGLQTTASSYELLSSDDKVKFLNDVEEALRRNLGNRPYFNLEEEIHVCYGLKLSN